MFQTITKTVATLHIYIYIYKTIYNYNNTQSLIACEVYFSWRREKLYY